MLGAFPGWVRALMRTRVAGVAPLGLETCRRLADPDDPAQGGRSARIGMFPVRGLGPDEIVMDAPDRHLDLRTSVIRTAADPGRIQIVIWVRRRDASGHVHQAAVTPFRRLFVRDSLARLSGPA